MLTESLPCFDWLYNSYIAPAKSAMNVNLTYDGRAFNYLHRILSVEDATKRKEILSKMARTSEIELERGVLQNSSET